MAGINKVIIVGNLGKDPEVRYLEGGVGVANFPVATSETYRDKQTGERRTQTEWHNIVVWRGLAEIAEKYLKKGNQVYIEGKLRTRSWQDQTGNTRYTTEVVADNLMMLGGANPGGTGPAQPSPGASGPATPTSTPPSTDNQDEVDDLPF